VGGFRIAAVEHDARWAQRVTEQLDREGTGSDVVVVHAHLAPHPRAERGLSRYDDAALSEGLRAALRGDPIDLLLVVDGPPAYATGHGLARYPALPVLCDLLAPGATVVLDGAERPGSRTCSDAGSTRPGSTSTVGPTGRRGRGPIGGAGPVTGPRRG
jgi:hypothetical protein